MYITLYTQIHNLAPITFKGTGLVSSDIKVNDIVAGKDTQSEGQGRKQNVTSSQIRRMLKGIPKDYAFGCKSLSTKNNLSKDTFHIQP